MQEQPKSSFKKKYPQKDGQQVPNKPKQDKHKESKSAQQKAGNKSGYKANNKTAAPTQRRAPQDANDLAIGDRIVVTIKRIGINGEGVGYYKRKAVFIDGALTGEVVKAIITLIQTSFVQAKLVEIEKKSNSRQQPPCPVYEQCGGCQLQHMMYEAQLIAKADIVAEAFSRYAKLDRSQLQLKPTLGLEQPWHYRNKAQLQVGRAGQQLITGLYTAGTHQLIDISHCLVQDQAINDVYQKLKPIMTQYNIEPYREKTNQGQLKTIVVRIAKYSEELQLTFVTASSAPLPKQDALLADIIAELPQIKSINQNIHPNRSSLIFGDKTLLLWGNSYIEEQLGELKFSLSARAFFQLNPTQVVHLYNLAKEAAQLTGTESVVDLYCGTGTIGLWLAPYAKDVRGIEVIAEAVEDANRNAASSGITNAAFYYGRAEDVLPKWQRDGYKPDVVVLDPPRTGLDQALIKTLLQHKPQRIVYVSCNPSTLAKDCAQLLMSGQYRLGWIQPVDMFAQTASVEVVTYLEKL